MEEKKENHPRGLFDSLNEAFWCTDYNAKNFSSLQNQISEKNEEKPKKIGIFEKMVFFWRFLLIFFRNGTLLKAEVFCIASSASKRSI